jgi:hypothetical protein
MLVGNSNLLTKDISTRLPTQSMTHPGSRVGGLYNNLPVAYRTVLEKQITAQLINKSPALYGILISKKHFKCHKQRNE